MLITIFNSTHESPDRAPAHTHQSKLSIPDLPPLKLIPAQTQANTTPPTTHESPELYGLTGGANTAAVFALVLAVPAALAILKLRPDSQPTPKANTTATKEAEAHVKAEDEYALH